MDYNAKMKELDILWEDSFALCRAMITACKNGEAKLTGSILKEINNFIKQSVDFLRFREEEEAFQIQEEEENEDGELKALEGCVLPDASEDTFETKEQETSQGNDIDGSELELPNFFDE